MRLICGTYRFTLFSLVFVIGLTTQAQIQLAFQGGEPGNNWNYVSSGTDATAQAQAFLLNNIVSGSQSIVVGGNTGGGSCIDGGSGNGPNVERFFTFDPVDISSSSQFNRTLSFHWGTRHPICVGTGWDSGENLVFTAYHDGVVQPSITLAVGNNNANFNIQNFIHTHTIPPCVNSFYFHITITTNRRDELLFLDNVSLTTPQLNGSPTQLNQTICQSELPYNWNGVIFNQAGSQIQTLSNSFGCDSLVQYNLTVNNPVLPTFPDFGSFCSWQNIPPLPTNSLNNISGIWSPAINNSQTTTYTFTPNTGQCANSATKTIAVNTNVTPTFSQFGAYCSGATIPSLPTTSQNNILGSWSPAINNQQTTSYTFSPSSGQCATTTSMTVEILPNVVPQFDTVGSFCEGAPIPILPNVSLNNISGTWSPAINNQQTTTYTFNPNQGICASSTTLTIAIEPNLPPQFASPGSFCPNANIPNLPSTSLNNISGSWSPSINNQQTTTYTFIPDAGICALSTTMTILVESSVVPVFDFPLNHCVGDTIPDLPTTSLNGINGSWSPQLNNQITTNYSFTPFQDQCAVPTNITLTLSNYIEPTFDIITTYCSGASIPDLPTISLNNLSGSWSPQIDNMFTSTYTFLPDLIQSSGNNCVLESSITLSITPSVLLEFPFFPPICQGASMQALPETSQNGISGFWTPQLNNQVTTTYNFTPTSGTCNQATSQTVVVLPVDTTYFNITICEGQLPYSWQGLTVTNSGSYSVNTASSNGCGAVSVLNLEVIMNPIVNQSIILCNDDYPYNYFGQSISASGLYQWTSNNISGCDTTYQLVVTTHPTTPITFNQPAINSCNTPVSVTYSLSDISQFNNCTWTMNGETGYNCDGFAVNLAQIGCYDLSFSAVDQHGCLTTVTQENMVCIHPNPVASFTLESNFVEVGETIYPVNISQGASSYIWNFGAGNTNSGFSPQFSFEESGQYEISLIALSEFGCLNEYTTLVSVSDATLIYVPNAFTPGGFDLNEVFLPVITSGINRDKYRFYVFNRWGEIMFESQHPDVGWDGSYGNDLCPSGVYVWKIDFESSSGVNRSMVGHVNLLR